MHFTKMHGIGNDFIIVDCLGSNGPELAQEAQERAVALNDRKFGIGGDGVLLILPSQSAPFRMRMFNPDGSEAEMCGNGIRCFAKYLFDHGYTNGTTDLPVETGAGLLRVECTVGNDSKIATVRVDMGEPRLIAEEIPTLLADCDLTVIAKPLHLGDMTLTVTCVSMGNPHAVTFVDRVADYPVEIVGRQVETHAAFPRRTNTEFIQIISRQEIRFRVWERGAGETLACGTGACAAVVAAVLNDLTDRNTLVHLPGGDLQIEWSSEDNHVYMTGAAETVFEGDTQP